MLSINTNLSSLIAQQSMKTSTDKLNQAIERMTTGAKINHAKDNAANYSISTNMTTKMSAYQVAEDNAMMGLDMVSNAEDTLSLIQDKLQRLRALEEQSNNGTYGEQSKLAINSEANSLVDEINRLYSTAEYNGKKLFSAEKPKLTNAVTKRDTSSMDKMADVDKTQNLASGTYSISTVEDLEKLAYLANNGKLFDGASLTAHGTYEFVLTNDIDLSGINWTSIGGAPAIDLDGDGVVDESDMGAFCGIFDGNGYTISNMTQNLSGTEDTPIACAGFFGYTFDADIKNLTLENINIEGNSVTYAGSLVAYCLDTSISNCSVNGNICIEKGFYIGGLIGIFYTGNVNNEDKSLKDCIVNVNLDSTDMLCGGGVISYLTTDSCNVIVDNIDYQGRINSVTYAAGLAYGIETSSGCCDIKNVTINADIKSELISAGLVISVQPDGGNCNITNCYITGSVSAVNNDEEVAVYGIGSLDDGTSISNCIADVALSAESNVDTHLYFLYAEDTVAFNNIQCNTDKNPGVDLYDASSGNPTLTNVTPIDTSKPLDLTGIGFKYNNPKANVGISIEFQVGINGDSSSQIKFNSSFELDGVNNLRYIGKDNTSRLGMIDNMLNEISAKQTEYGAASNRLMSVLDEISIQYENLASSRSTIRDADIAEVSAEYIQQQILQQASATLMSTANQSPSIALQLI